ncbi:alpha-hydroxy acid oxidase [Rhodococcus opacus]|uniref:Alpha-hydroxy acid oxidase n=1 Tax=Rhodococcus opacus TaxID=37919 RepID=A0AAX3YTC4_RHOOP|nr:alpha-hydroxy acid oxidase [Rhodococcus opacus]MCZ4587621.1 alpha-hydroxy acid oxidase [Rhodococcus opacus]WLF51383.1 alpha-hydroxy acid oxidase [Rhodococcus opacus]
MTSRRFPTWSGIRPFLQFQRPSLRRHQVALDRACTIRDLRSIADKRVPRMVFDYVDGAAEQEIGISRARSTFQHVEFQPGVLRDVSATSTSTTVGGHLSRVPFGIAPTGFTRLMHHDGEKAGVRAAEKHGMPFALSTMGTLSLEEVRDAAPQAERWFQLYLWRERDKSMALVDRAWKAGYRTLVVTVDTPVGGARLRDIRNGMTIPPTLGARTVSDIVRHPRWWVDLLTTEPLSFASLDSRAGSVAQLVNEMFDPTLTFADLDWLRAEWQGRLVVKGVQTVDDARTCVEHGVDALILSNHGGRQLDRAPVPLRLLPHVKRALAGTGAEIYLDTGILTGGDIVAALALGADFTFVGRAYLYGLMAGGQRGVERAIAILSEEIERTMQLMGVRSISELTPDHVRILDNVNDTRTNSSVKH